MQLSQYHIISGNSHVHNTGKFSLLSLLAMIGFKKSRLKYENDKISGSEVVEGEVRRQVLSFHIPRKPNIILQFVSPLCTY